MQVDIAVLKSDMERLSQAVEENSRSTRELVEAWQAATGLVRFVKWLAGLAGAIGVIYAAFRGMPQ